MRRDVWRSFPFGELAVVVVVWVFVVVMLLVDRG